jgi:flagellar L-ring protein precursor FlgH
MRCGRAGLIALGIALDLVAAVNAVAQTSSIGARHRAEKPATTLDQPTREEGPRPRNATYERHSWISVAPAPPKKFRPGDLLTIIVRERREWEAESDLERRKRYELRSELQDFIKLTDGGVGSAGFTRGQPNINYKLNENLRSEGDSSREDRLTTRITGKIVDVKPNGLLVIEGQERIAHDEEVAVITITGTCRKEDVTADNSVLSTQLADKEIVVTTEGALHAASTRGWLLKLLDLLKPI